MECLLFEQLSTRSEGVLLSFRFFGGAAGAGIIARKQTENCCEIELAANAFRVECLWIVMFGIYSRYCCWCYLGLITVWLFKLEWQKTKEGAVKFKQFFLGYNLMQQL